MMPLLWVRCWARSVVFLLYSRERCICNSYLTASGHLTEKWFQSSRKGKIGAILCFFWKSVDWFTTMSNEHLMYIVFDYVLWLSFPYHVLLNHKPFHFANIAGRPCSFGFPLGWAWSNPFDMCSMNKYGTSLQLHVVCICLLCFLFGDLSVMRVGYQELWAAQRQGSDKVNLRCSNG